MSSLRRILIMAEMHGRDLTKRHATLGLLVALPLSFYLASMGSGAKSIIAAGVGMAFAISGATLFSVLSSGDVDQRLVLSGYRPHELLLGRLLFLGTDGTGHRNRFRRADEHGLAPHTPMAHLSRGGRGRARIDSLRTRGWRHGSPRARRHARAHRRGRTATGGRADLGRSRGSSRSTGRDS